MNHSKNQKMEENLTNNRINCSLECEDMDSNNNVQINSYKPNIFEDAKLKIKKIRNEKILESEVMFQYHGCNDCADWNDCMEEDPYIPCNDEK